MPPRDKLKDYNASNDKKLLLYLPSVDENDEDLDINDNDDSDESIFDDDSLEEEVESEANDDEDEKPREWKGHKFTRGKVTNYKRATVPEAIELYTNANSLINVRHDLQTQDLRRTFYDLVHCEVYDVLLTHANGIVPKKQTEREFFQKIIGPLRPKRQRRNRNGERPPREIIESTVKRHRSTLYDYLNTAYVEVALGLEQGVHSVDALVELKRNNPEKEALREIWALAKCYIDDDDRVTKKAILTAKEHYNRVHNIPEKRDELDDYLDELSDNRKALDDDDKCTPDQTKTNKANNPTTTPAIPENIGNQQHIAVINGVTAEEAFKKINKYSFDDLKKLKFRIFPNGKVGKFAYRILREMPEEELDKFKEMFSEYYVDKELGDDE